MKPKLRFKEFTDEWEEKKLGEIATFLDNYRQPIRSEERKIGKYPYYGSTGIIDYVDNYIFEGTFLLLSEDGANIIDRNYRITYIASGKFWVNNHAHILDVKGNIYFLSELLEKLNYEKYNTGTVQPKLNKDVCQNIRIYIPSLLEQEKIGRFFSLIDQRIEKQERKIVLLEEEKKGYMQKLFKQELRFKDKKGNDYPSWEEKKLGKIADIKAGKDLDKSKLMNVGYPVYGNALTNKGLMGYYDTYEIKDKAVTVTGRGDIGKAFYREGKFNTVGRLISIVSKENPYFLTYAINKIKILNETTGVPQLTALQLKKYKVQLPSLPEQEKIANFLSLLDQRIEKEQEKLKLMKKEKQGLAQKLFI